MDTADDREDRSGVFLLRAWVHEGQVVARIRATAAGQVEQRVEVALGAEAIEETVREWLRDLGETPP